MKYWVYIVAAAWMGITCAAAQDPGLYFRKLKKIRENNFDFVSDICKDSKGRIWIGAQIGFFRYDGENFIEYKVNKDSGQYLNTFIHAVCEDREGNIWGSTDIGIFRFSPETNKVKRYYLPESAQVNSVTDIICDKYGIIRGVSPFQIFRFDARGDSLRIECDLRETGGGLPPAKIKKRGLLYDSVGHTIWLATNQGLMYFDIGRARLNSRSNNPAVPLFFSPNASAVAHAGSQGFAFFDNYMKEVIFFNPQTLSVTRRISVRHKLPVGLGGSLFVGADKRIWLSSWTDEVLMIDQQNGDSVYMLSVHGFDYLKFPSTFFWRAMQDEDANIWFATPDGIVVCNADKNLYRYHRISALVKERLPNESINTLMENPADKTWWMTTTHNKVLQYNPITGRLNTGLFAEAIPGNKGSMPISTIGISLFESRPAFNFLEGIWVWDNAAGRMIPLEKHVGDTLPIRPHVVIPAKGGGYILYNDVQRGLWQPATGSFTPFSGTSENNPDSYGFTLKYKGRLNAPQYALHGFGWASAISGTKLKTVNLIPDERLAWSGFVEDTDVDTKGHLWMSYKGFGLFEYNPGDGSIRHYQDKDGVPVPAESIAVDTFNNVWGMFRRYVSVLLAENRQFYRLSLPVTTHSHTWYNATTALGRGTILTNAFCDLVEFFPERLLQIPYARKPQISRVIAGNADIRIKAGETVVLQPEENDIRLWFGLLTDKYVFPYVLQYRLEGADNEWRRAGDAAEASYLKLPAGTYTFRVKAIGVNGKWESEEAALTIEIKRHFYNSIWFYLSLTLLLGALLYAFYRFRLRQQRQLFDLRNRASALEREKATIQYDSLKQQLNPHFLFNSLTSLYGLIQTDQDVASEFLDRMSGIYRYILKNGDHETVTLQEELSFVQLYIDLQQTRFGKGLQVHIDVPDDYRSFRIAPVTLQNMIENALKHNIVDPESPLVITIAASGDYLCIRNNLQKKNVVETSNKQGLVQLKKLYSYLSEKPVDIREEAGYFEIRIPFI